MKFPEFIQRFLSNMLYPLYGKTKRPQKVDNVEPVGNSHYEEYFMEHASIKNVD